MEILLNIGYKQDRFSKTLLEKDLRFVLNRKDGIVTFNLSLVLLLAEVDSVAKKQSCKKETFRVCNIGHIKIIFALLAEVIIFYM